MTTRVYYSKTETKSDVPRLVKEAGADTKQKELETFGADYVLLSRLFRVGIERKDVDDFLSTITGDGVHTMNNQLVKLSRHFDRALLLLEGDLAQAINNREISRQFVYATLAGITVKRADRGCQGAVSIVPTANKYDTALYIYFLWKRIKNTDLVRFPKLEPLEFSSSDYFHAILGSIPDVGPKRALLLKNKFKTLRKLFSATPEEIQSIKGIGKTTVNSISEILDMS